MSTINKGNIFFILSKFHNLWKYDKNTRAKVGQRFEYTTRRTLWDLVNID